MISLPKGKIAMTPLFDPMTTKGGLFVPDQARERCDQGIVKYIAPDEENFKIGDYVLFSAYDGTLVEIDGELLILMKSETLVCKIAPPQYLNTVIRGLYFKSDYLIANSVNHVVNAIQMHFGILKDDEKEQALRADIFKILVADRAETFFEANYEQAMELVSAELTQLGYPHRFRFKNRKDSAPKTEDFNASTR
jgi:co-chaperonin GroES (HSP10)